MASSICKYFLCLKGKYIKAGNGESAHSYGVLGDRSPFVQLNGDGEPPAFKVRVGGAAGLAGVQDSKCSHQGKERAGKAFPTL